MKALKLSAVFLPLLISACSTPLEEHGDRMEQNASLNRTFRENEHKLQACYRNGLKALNLESLPPAFIRYEITIGGLGGVIDVSLIETTLNRPEIENCIAKEFSTYQFQGVKQTILTETIDTKQLE